MGLNRRAFLARLGGTLATLGLAEAALPQWAARYQAVLAQPTRRKLALLIGINQYSEQVCDYTITKGTALNGCLTDVALQQELLLHRFGFQPADIVTLTDQQATRGAIETAFTEHLINQAQPGDVVVFHFSGLGSRINTGEVSASAQNSPSQNSLVCIDSVLPTPDNPAISDLPIETLALMLRALQTDQITTVLDASYTSRGRILQGNLRIRSRPIAPSGQIDAAELELQEHWLSRTRLTRSQIRDPWQSGQLPGVVLLAAGPHQIATETQWSGFSSGLLTYALTQQLWWATETTTLQASFGQAIGSMKQIAGTEQRPRLLGRISPSRSAGSQNPVGLSTGADGVVQAIDEEGRAKLWLGGLPGAVLENYSPGSVLAVAPPNTDELLLQLRSRDGLTAKARPCNPQASLSNTLNQPIYERTRVLPRNIGLTVALDASLERIERVDATSAFAAIPKVSSVIAGEQSADFLFAKSQSSSPTLTAALPKSSSSATDVLIDAPTAAPRGYGLFYLGRDAIASTLVQGDEAVKTAIQRMAPQLRTLLAAKLLRLTANQGSSRLGIQAVLERVAPQSQILLHQTVRSPWNAPQNHTLTQVDESLLELAAGSRIRYRLLNYSDRPLYFVLLGLDSSGNAIALYPGNSPDAAAAASVIQPGETLIPKIDAADGMIQATPGLAETYLVFSSSPLAAAYTAMQQSAQSKTNLDGIILLPNPLDVVQAILQDLHQASQPHCPQVELPVDAYALDVNAWATLSFVYQVIDA